MRILGRFSLLIGVSAFGGFLIFYTPVYAQSAFYRNLTVGSTGADVLALQKFLIQNGFLAIANPTTYFGPKTTLAVTAWQAYVGLPPTGYFGSLSRAKIQTALGNTSTPTPTPSPTPTVTPAPASSLSTSVFTRNLTTGDSGADVKSLQAFLIAQGVLPIAQPTGVFGSLTAAAVMKWQASEGINPTGYFGPVSRAALQNNSGGTTGAIAISPTPTPATIPPSNPKTSPSITSTPSAGQITQPAVQSTGGGGGGGNPPVSPAPAPSPAPTPSPSPAPVVDVTPPTASITVPTPSSTVSGRITIFTNASDNIGVTKVELYVDSVLQSNLTNSPYNFSFSTQTLTNGTHILSAKSYDAAGNTGIAPNVSITVNNPDILPPSVPTNIVATAVSSTQINLAWTASTDNTSVTGYKIFRAGTQIATTTVSSYQNNGLFASTLYTYTIAAYDAAGNVSAQSSGVSTTTLAAPTDNIPPLVSVTSPTANGSVLGQISVTSNVSDNVGVIRVELYVDGVLKTTTTTIPAIFPLNTALLTIGAHTIVEKAYDAAGNSATSITVPITVLSSVPTVPQNLVVTAITTSTISLSWSPSTEPGGSVTGYKLFQAATQIATTTVTSFSSVGLSASTTYSYSVASYDPSGSTSATSTSVTTTTLSLPIPTPTSTALNYNYGFSVGQNLLGLTPTVQTADLDDIAAMGIGWIRFDIQWDAVQPGNANQWNWDEIDRFVANANAHHIKLLPILDYTPLWAATPSCATGGTVRCAPVSAAQFATFAQTVVSRYASQGVSNWEIWNEENLGGSWLPGADANAYTTLLKAAYTAIKSVQPSATVILGGMGPAATANGNIAPLDFLTQMYADGAQGYFDGVGDHPYSYPAMPLAFYSWNAWSQIATTNSSLQSIMAAHGDGNKKIWLTEYGAPTGGPGNLESSAFDTTFAGAPDHVTEALQAQMLSQAMTGILNTTWAGPLFLYSYKDIGTTQDTIENFFGVIRYDGSTKPAYQTIRTLLGT